MSYQSLILHLVSRNNNYNFSYQEACKKVRICKDSGITVYEPTMINDDDNDDGGDDDVTDRVMTIMVILMISTMP